MHPDAERFLELFVETRQSLLEKGAYPTYVAVNWSLFDRAESVGILPAPQDTYVGGYNSDLMGVVIEPRDLEYPNNEIKVVEMICAECCQEMLNCKRGRFCPVCGTKDF